MRVLLCIAQPRRPLHSGSVPSKPRISFTKHYVYELPTVNHEDLLSPRSASEYFTHNIRTFLTLFKYNNKGSRQPTSRSLHRTSHSELLSWTDNSPKNDVRIKHNEEIWSQTQQGQRRLPLRVSSKFKPIRSSARRGPIHE